jgi:hypothetical protein
MNDIFFEISGQVLTDFEYYYFTYVPPLGSGGYAKASPNGLIVRQQHNAIGVYSI